ncbi:MAG: hypothetical protein ABL950_01520 [Nitrospira sp.]
MLMSPRGKKRSAHGEQTVKTTIEIEESIWRKIKIEAAQDRSDLRAVVMKALTAYFKRSPRREG